MMAMITVALVALLTPVSSFPVHIGCDFTVVQGKSNAGVNVMTGNSAIMGVVPTTVTALASASSATFTSGSTVTITFSSSFVRGVAHATAGTITSAAFGDTATAGATSCTGTETIKYKNAGGQTSPITWTAPSDVTALTSVTLSFASGSGFGQPVYRQTITLTKAGGGGVGTGSGAGSPTTTPAAGSGGSGATNSPTATPAVGSGGSGATNSPTGTAAATGSGYPQAPAYGVTGGSVDATLPIVALLVATLLA